MNGENRIGMNVDIFGLIKFISYYQTLSIIIIRLIIIVQSVAALVGRAQCVYDSYGICNPKSIVGIENNSILRLVGINNIQM